MLFNEPKLLKLIEKGDSTRTRIDFSALQRAEIAEILPVSYQVKEETNFSALQRAEIAEIARSSQTAAVQYQHFSALQRAEIAEIR